MAKLTLVKDLRTGSTTLLQLLGTFVFGDKAISIYDPNHIYEYGNLIINIDPDNGRVKILQCQDNNVTGQFDISKWESVVIGDTATQGAAKIFSMGPTEPTDKANMFWFRPLKSQHVTLPGTKTIENIRVDGNASIRILNSPYVEGQNISVSPVFSLKKVEDAKP